MSSSIFDLDFDGDVDNSDIIAIVFPSTDSSMSTAYYIAVAQLVLFVAVVFYPNHKLEQLVGGQVTGLVNGGYALLGIVGTCYLLYEQTAVLFSNENKHETILKAQRNFYLIALNVVLSLAIYQIIALHNKAGKLFRSVVRYDQKLKKAQSEAKKTRVGAGVSTRSATAAKKKVKGGE